MDESYLSHRFIFHKHLWFYILIAFNIYLNTVLYYRGFIFTNTNTQYWKWTRFHNVIGDRAIK